MGHVGQRKAVNPEEVRRDMAMPLVTKSTLSVLPAAYRERVHNAMAMYRGGARKQSIVEKHGSIVAAEALTELNRSCPRWWVS